MKNFILTSALLLSGFAYSEQGPEPTNSVTSNNHQVYVGADVLVEHVKIYEYDKIDTYNSTLGGLRLGYDYCNPSASYFGIDGLVAMGRGTAKYKYRWDGSLFSKRQSTPLFANLESRYGYTYQTPFSKKTILIPFVGLGGYYIRPQFKSGSMYFNWLYGAGGLRIAQQLCNNFDAGFNLKAMYILAGKTQIMDYVRKFRNIWGYEIAMPLTLRIGESKKWDIQFQPYLLKLAINTTGQIIGARLAAGCNF